jgi:hypothetical protein
MTDGIFTPFRSEAPRYTKRPGPNEKFVIPENLSNTMFQRFQN